MKNSAMKRTHHAFSLLFVALLAAVTIAVLRNSHTRIVPRPDGSASPTASTKPDSRLYERIHISMAAATSRNDQAITLCESEINRVLAREFAEIGRKGDQAAAEVATYQSCCSIIYRLARDKVCGGTTASAYVDEKLGRRLRPALQTCSRELDSTLARFDRSLAESTVMFASELAELRDSTKSSPVTVSVEVQLDGDLDATLENLGFQATGISVGGVLDVWALMNSRFAQVLLGEAARMAAAMFARPAAAIAAEATVAAADGPLPFGDAIALVGGVWTAYDIYATRAAFERELKTTIANALPDMKRSVHDQVMTRIRGTLDAHRRVQDSIRTASTNSINQ